LDIGNSATTLGEHDRLMAMSVETALPTPTVTLSRRAAARIAEILKEEPRPALLRLAVSGGGCSGFQYDFRLDEARAEGDLVIREGDAVVVIDPVSLDFLKGAEIDFVDEMIGAAFKVKNPNATSSCGCGTSFSL
jgi:iron-sulfur cluster assembly accessory protein